jgi:tetratricopeptide (TPR) repeat protein
MLSASLGRVERLDRFRREAEVVARLQHPNIVAIYEVGEWQPPGLAVPLPYFTMEYVKGNSLAQKLAAAPLTARAAAQLLENLARAMHFAHEHGVLHRDLKPANVLLQEETTTNNTNYTNKDKEGKQDSSSDSSSIREIREIRGSPLLPKITDFGLAKLLAGEPDHDFVTAPTETGVILGTPGYMAPEQAGGPSVAVGPAADVYGLGAILYECLTGRPPFRAATPLLTLDLVRAQEPAPPRQLNATIPADMETICLKCLSKEPGQRYGSARELAEDLGRYLGGEPIRARRAGAWERAWKWTQRRPAAAALVAVSVLSTLALTVGVLIHNARLQESVAQARANEAEARTQHEESEARYHAARDSMGRMVDRLNAQRLADMPRLKELRQELLEDSLAFYQAVLKQADNPDPAVRLDTAFAYLQTGEIQQLLGQPALAKENFWKAVTLLEELPAADRDLPESRIRLAVCHSHLATLAGNAGQWKEAERHYRTAFTLRERLALEQPDNPTWQNELARAEHSLAVLCQFTKRLPEAETHYLRAVAIRTLLIAVYPQVEDYQAQLAESHLNLVVVYGLLGRRPESQAANDKGIGILRVLTDRHPEVVDYQLSLAGALSNTGLGLMIRGKPRDALALLTQAIKLAEAVLRHEPRHSTASTRAFSAHGARAQVNEMLGRWTEAVGDWDRVVALDRGSDAWTRQVLRAVALARAGEHVRATSESQALDKVADVTAEGRYNLACVCALSIGHARKDIRLDSAERSALAERYAVQAVALLQKVQSQGYFKNAQRAKALADDADLSGLRGRADFQQLLKQVQPNK